MDEERKDVLLPPTDIDAEKAVLGSMLKNQDARADVIALLRKNGLIEFIDQFFLSGNWLEHDAFQKVGNGERVADSIALDGPVEPEACRHEHLGWLIRTDTAVQGVGDGERGVCGHGSGLYQA